MCVCCIRSNQIYYTEDANAFEIYRKEIVALTHPCEHPSCANAKDKYSIKFVCVRVFRYTMHLIRALLSACAHLLKLIHRFLFSAELRFLGIVILIDRRYAFFYLVLLFLHRCERTRNFLHSHISLSRVHFSIVVL